MSSTVAWMSSRCPYIHQGSLLLPYGCTGYTHNETGQVKSVFETTIGGSKPSLKMFTSLGFLKGRGVCQLWVNHLPGDCCWVLGFPKPWDHAHVTLISWQVFEWYGFLRYLVPAEYWRCWIVSDSLFFDFSFRMFPWISRLNWSTPTESWMRWNPMG